MIFLVNLRVLDLQSAAKHIDGHSAWIQAGLDAGTILLVGNLEPGPGGAVLLQLATRGEVDRLLAEDPFVTHNVVDTEIVQIKPHTAAPQLQFLVG